MTQHCHVTDAKDSVWSFCPNSGASYLFAVLFGVLFIAHGVQAYLTRKFYSIVIILSALLQVIAFSGRIASINAPASTGLWAMWFVIILVAPLFTNAYVYMVMGRMVHNFLPDKQLCGIKSRRFGLYFVVLDFIAFCVQCGGASTTAGDNRTTKQINNSLHVYMIGVGIQQLFILIFTLIAIRFQQRIKLESPPGHQTRALRLLYISYAGLALITLRIVFRMIEYSKGIDSSIPNHEWTMYVFDTVPMWIAILLFNVVHPGRLMPGKESDIPGRREYRREREMEKRASEGGVTYETVVGIGQGGSSGSVELGAGGPGKQPVALARGADMV